MDIHSDVIKASYDFAELLKKCTVSVGQAGVVSQQDLLAISRATTPYKTIDNFYSSLAANGKLQDFHEFCEENKKNNAATWDVYVSPLQAYQLHNLVWTSLRDGWVEDPVLAKEILSKSKVLSLIHNGDISEKIISVVDNAIFRKLSDPNEIMDLASNQQTIFTKLDGSSVEFKAYETSVMKVKDGSITLWEHLENTESLIICFDEVAKGLFDVSVMFYESDNKEYLTKVCGILGGYYDLNDGLIKLGRVDDRLGADPAKSSEILANLFKLMVEYRSIYFANIDYVYTNNFLTIMEPAEKTNADSHVAKYQKLS